MDAHISAILVPNEEYIWITTSGTFKLYSLVTFKPANIDDAPLMVIDTYRNKVTIGLPRSVDEWEVKSRYSKTHIFAALHM